MDNAEHQRRVLHSLEVAVAPDHAKTHIHGFTALSAEPTWQNITWGFNNLCRAVCYHIGDELDQQSRHVSTSFW